MKQLVIFDVDGTVCDITHRLHHIRFNASIHGFEKDFKKNWPKFFEECVNDKPKYDVIALLHMLRMDCDIKFFSGRSDVVREQTLQWLSVHVQYPDRAFAIPYSQIDLTMRKDGDYRVDYEVKQEMYDNLSDEDKERLLCTFDDRDQVVKMWRSNNVTCCQVAEGDF